MEATTKRKLIRTGAGLVFVLAAYGVYWYLTQEKATGERSFSNPTNKGKTKPIVFPLRIGSKGEEVGKLQKALNQKLRPPLNQLIADKRLESKILIALRTITVTSDVYQRE